MTVLEASSGTYRSRVDGTIVLSVEIEPRHRAAALALFGMPGTPMALAALKPASSKPEKAESPVGELCRWAAIRCTEKPFQDWLAEVHHWKGIPVTEAHCADAIRTTCGIKSRTELDTNEEAAVIFHREIREPFARWSRQQARSASAPSIKPRATVE